MWSKDDGNEGCARCGNRARLKVLIGDRLFCDTGPPPTCREYEQAAIERVAWLEEHNVI